MFSFGPEQTVGTDSSDDPRMTLECRRGLIVKTHDKHHTKWWSKSDHKMLYFITSLSVVDSGVNL